MAIGCAWHTDLGVLNLNLQQQQHTSCQGPGDTVPGVTLLASSRLAKTVAQRVRIEQNPET